MPDIAHKFCMLRSLKQRSLTQLFFFNFFLSFFILFTNIFTRVIPISCTCLCSSIYRCTPYSFYISYTQHTLTNTLLGTLGIVTVLRRSDTSAKPLLKSSLCICFYLLYSDLAGSKYDMTPYTQLNLCSLERVTLFKGGYLNSQGQNMTRNHMHNSTFVHLERVALFKGGQSP